jgi:hypothetical protein
MTSIGLQSQRRRKQRLLIPTATSRAQQMMFRTVRIPQVILRRTPRPAFAQVAHSQVIRKLSLGFVGYQSGESDALCKRSISTLMRVLILYVYFYSEIKDPFKSGGVVVSRRRVLQPCVSQLQCSFDRSTWRNSRRESIVTKVGRCPERPSSKAQRKECLCLVRPERFSKI